MYIYSFCFFDGRQYVLPYTYYVHVTYVSGDLRFVYRFLNDMILRLKSETLVRVHSLIYLRLQAGTIEDKTLALQMPLA